MPLTFLSHQAPVLPLKITWPRWFDGTALVIGSMTPDLFFVAHGTDVYPDAHTSAVAFLACLPVTLAVTWIVKRIIAGPLAVHLPDAGPFHLHDFARLSDWRRPSSVKGWTVLVLSALIGAISHVVIDSFTHGFGWVVQNVEALQHEAFVLQASGTDQPVHVHDLLQLGGTLIGATISIWCLHHIGRRRLLVSWYPAPPGLRATDASRRILSIASVGGILVGLVVAALCARLGGAQDFIIRFAGVMFISLAIGCATARRSMESVPSRPPEADVEGSSGRLDSSGV